MGRKGFQIKDIGFTPEGNRLVEMTKTEYFTLQRLNQAVEGKPVLPVDLLNDFRYAEFDLTNTFEVIRAWFTMKFRINETRILLDDLQASMERKER